MSAVRELTGVEVPAAGVWDLDPGHAEVGFVGRHFGLTKVRGRFTGVEGTATIGEALAASRVDGTIDRASVSTGDTGRDDHLRSGDFFDAANHPKATFHSTGLEVDGARATMPGELTIKGVTRPVVLDVEYLGYAADPWGNDRAVFSANAVINREDWGLTWNMLLEAGSLLVSKEIRLEIEAEFIRRTENT